VDVATFSSLDGCLPVQAVTTNAAVTIRINVIMLLVLIVFPPIINHEETR
jgi:hypothetical protein